MDTTVSQDVARREREIFKVTFAGSLINLALLTFKFVAGIAGHSAAMLADAVHSLSDFATDIVVIVFVRISSKPEDKSHDYGHGKYETLATAIIGLLLVGVGLGILWQGASSVWRYAHGEQLGEPGMVALVAALVSIVSKELLYQYTRLKGKRLQSQAVIANAWHHRSDALSSVGTALGIGGAIALGEAWRVLDPVAAMVVSVFILKVAWQMLVPCVDELLERSLPAEEEDEIVRLILQTPGVSQPHHLRTRRIGNYCSIDVHVRMDGRLSLTQAHDTASAIEQRLKERFGPQTLTSIHVEPTKGTPPVTQARDTAVPTADNQTSTSTNNRSDS